MARGGLSVIGVLLLGLLELFTIADTDANKANLQSSGSSDSLTYEAIQTVELYTDNATAPTSQIPPVDGWWESNVCAGAYCVYVNRRLVKGRGMVAVTKAEEFQKLSRLEEHLDRGENRYFDAPPPFASTPILNKGTGLTATTPLRRGKPLMSWSPVLLVHTSLFDDIPKKKDRTALLEAAISFLPPETLIKFNTQRTPNPSTPEPPKQRSIEQILLAHPFEIDLGYATPHRQNQDEPVPHSKHYANYPEAAIFQHDCRPNVAWHMDEAFALRMTVARKTAVGEELSVSYVDLFLERGERSAWVGKHRGGGMSKEGGCACRACNPPGGPKGEEGEIVEKRLKEILRMRGVLRNQESKGVTVKMVERFVKLFEEERLQVRLAEAYELAALNFNYLGEDKKAKKYADLAVQAGIVEGGTGSNEVAAMRVMARDVKGHYSYRFRLKS